MYVSYFCRNILAAGLKKKEGVGIPFVSFNKPLKSYIPFLRLLQT